MQIHNSILPFKENRNYIKAEDMFNEMLRYFINKRLTDINFTIHKLSMNNQVQIQITTNVEAFKTLVQTPHAVINLTADSQKYWVAFSPKNEQPKEIVRKPHDENILIEKCQIRGENISLSVTSPYTFLETIVSMHKKLLQTLYPNKGNWLFTKLILTNYDTTHENITISFKKNFNFKLVKSDVFTDDKLVGEIYFSLPG